MIDSVSSRPAQPLPPPPPVLITLWCRPAYEAGVSLCLLVVEAGMHLSPYTVLSTCLAFRTHSLPLSPPPRQVLPERRRLPGLFRPHKSLQL